MTKSKKNTDKVCEPIEQQECQESELDRFKSEMKKEIKKEVKEESMNIMTSLLSAGLLFISAFMTLFYMPIFFAIIAMVGCLHSAYKAISTSKPTILFLKEIGFEIKIETK